MKTKTIGIALFTIILLLNFMTLGAITIGFGLPAPTPHNADAMWVEPSSVTFDNTTASVGTKFNVTVWLNMTEDIFAWQVGMLYNRTQLKCTRSAFTGGATSNYSAGHSTSPAPPTIDTSFLGNGSILASESCLGSDNVTGPQSGSLMWAEFQVLVVPTAGNLTSAFDITKKYPASTWVKDPTLVKITITTYNAAYLFIGPPGPPPPPPPLSVSISPLSTTIHLGQTVHFTSTPNGGIPPYSYQWFLNGSSVPGANSNNWNFTPITVETDTVYLAVTDNNGTTADSSNALVTVTPPPSGARIYVDPQEILNLTMGPSNTFYVNITIANVTNVKTVAFNLSYVPSVIKWIGIQVLKVQGEFPTTTMTVDGNAGFVWVNLNYSTPISTDDTSIPVACLRFHVETYGISPLNLTDTQLLDSDGNPITHDEFDGLFSNIIRDVAVTNVVPSTNWIYQGWIDNINVTVENLGNVSETFTVSAYYNSSLIGTALISSLAPNAETTVTIPWDTTGVPEGNYTIIGVASIVPYEYNTTNNVYVDGIVQVVTIIHDVAITGVTPEKSWVYRSYPLKINVTAANLGNVSESFNVTAYADNYTIGTSSVTNLASNAQITLTFIWDTTSAQLCHNYTLRGEASLLPLEYNTTNNVYVDGTVTIRLIGDVNGDGVVDGADIAIIAKAFGSYGPSFLYPGSPSHPRWNPDADINLDNIVDGSDLIMVARYFGTFCP